MSFTIKRSDDSIFIFDAVLSYSTAWGSDITEFPVENGDTISDHIINRNVVINFEGIVSDAALVDNRVLATILKGNGVFDDIITLSQSTSLSAKGNSATQNLILYNMWRDKELFTLTVDNITYENVAFQNLDIPKDVGSSSSLRVNGQMKQITVVSTATTTVPKVDLAEDTKDSASDKNSKGTGQTATTEAEELRKIAERLADYAEGFNQ